MATKTKKSREWRSVKITEQAHYQLRFMMAKYRKHMWELVDEAVVLLGRARATNGRSKQKGKS